MLCLSDSLHIIIVTASGYTKELAHNRYWIHVPVLVDNCVFGFRPHFLSVNCRKSRSSLFSISSLAISLSYSSAVVNGRVRGRPLRFAGNPLVTAAFLLLYLVTQLSICFHSRPSSSAICVRLIPISRIFMISGSISLICVYFFLVITTPPDVVIILHQGAFCLLSVFTGAV